mmetsp:Transcript_62435/g.103846  ORF Transcript_62435/g.103846 Transcript_62435/m.103846 type:complete len:417 (+) Transcript_62435:111-1361(+)
MNEESRDRIQDCLEAEYADFVDRRGWSVRHGCCRRLLLPKRGKAALWAEIQGQGMEVLRGRSACKVSKKGGCGGRCRLDSYFAKRRSKLSKAMTADVKEVLHDHWEGTLLQTLDNYTRASTVELLADDCEEGNVTMANVCDEIVESEMSSINVQSEMTQSTAALGISRIHGTSPQGKNEQLTPWERAVIKAEIAARRYETLLPEHRPRATNCIDLSLLMVNIYMEPDNMRACITNLAGVDKGTYIFPLGSTLETLWRKVHRSLLSNAQRRKGWYRATFLDNNGGLVHDSQSLEAHRCLTIKRDWCKYTDMKPAAPKFPTPRWNHWPGPHHPDPYKQASGFTIPERKKPRMNYRYSYGRWWYVRSRKRSTKNNGDSLRRQLVRILGHSVALCPKTKERKAGCDLLHRLRLQRKQGRK